ncbi:type II secretion system F family protein [Candidatus Parcubacteria bacterium]|nr:type II secretion system F family protein [Candidatus Parcubacteria bacterium]
MLYLYKAINQTGQKTEGSIDAFSMEVAIDSLQKRGLVIITIDPAEKETWLSKLSFADKVKVKDVVILSRQMATLFEAQVSALKIFSLLAAEVENKRLQKILSEVANDLQGGSSISKALNKHPEVFSDFYVNMVKVGEETGKLNETFSYLADYLDRNYEVTSKAKNALIYPAFVITVFLGVMILMFTVIIPKISIILISSGAPIPVYTAIVFAISNFFLNDGWVLAAVVVIAGFVLYKYSKTDEGRTAIARFKLQVPFIGDLYKKLYLSIISDNMNTMILSGVPMVRAIEVTAAVVGNDVYKRILEDCMIAVESGSSFSKALSQYEDIPGILVQMVRVGEETGEVGSILKTMANFYRREVINAVDTLVSLIEPVMIVILGLGVGILLASVLIPIYDIANSAA